ncbi:hypothetical protein [Phyllobacterium sophorae]|uniref:Uncharacterized protein n=1 Tax=Phyllobacterium sophorae TaxID=1520277 RepID=A0A2P7BH70_9HYPH|nr:hypothetical protein [Phyllobacterium sophorae]PSH65820.1 hypothetical protein CU103_04160 [Phyllobacterium sophorae]
MTTISEVATALEPLLNRHDDLILVHRSILIGPIGYLWRIVNIDASVDPRAFVPQMAIGVIPSPLSYVDRRWGKRLYRSDAIPTDGEGSHLYHTGEESIEEMLELIENTLLPQLRSIASTRELLFQMSSGHFRGSSLFESAPLEFAARLIAGDFTTARMLIDENERMSEWLSWQNPALYPALVNHDGDRIACILREWEARAVRSMQLEAIWRRVPFEFERS